MNTDSHQLVTVSFHQVLSTIQHLVAMAWGVDTTVLCSRSRERAAVEARYVSMWILRQLYRSSSYQVAKEFSVSHNLVMYAVKTVDIRRDTDRVFNTRTDNLLTKIQTLCTQ
jgi:chromosomal replication initiation ATPase DnaA